MTNLIIFNRQIATLESDIRDYSRTLRNDSLASIKKLTFDMRTILDSYYEGGISVGITNGEMKVISNRLKRCQHEMKDIEYNPNEDDGKEFYYASNWFDQLIVEITNWSEAGRFQRE